MRNLLFLGDKHGRFELGGMDMNHTTGLERIVNGMCKMPFDNFVLERWKESACVCVPTQVSESIYLCFETNEENERRDRNRALCTEHIQYKRINY